MEYWSKVNESIVSALHMMNVFQFSKPTIGKINDIPELNKGQGVILQRYNDGQCADAKIIDSNSGLSWRQGKDRIRSEKNLITWIGKRGGTGKMPPRGFPNPPKFT